MVYNKSEDSITNKKYLYYAILSAIFASLVSFFIKLGLKDIPSDLGTLFRTILVFIFASLLVLTNKDYKGIKKTKSTTFVFLTLSGISTGAAWLLKYTALNIKYSNPIIINSLGKLSILGTMLFSFIILKEKFSKKSILGLFIMTIGIIISLLITLI